MGPRASQAFAVRFAVLFAGADFVAVEVDLVNRTDFVAVALVAFAVFAGALAALLAVDAVPAAGLLAPRTGVFLAPADDDAVAGAVFVAARLPLATDRVALTVALAAVALAAAVTFGSLRVPLTTSLKP